MAYSISTANTGEGLRDSNTPGSTAALRELWAKGVEVWEQSTDFFAAMEGGAEAIIETVSDTSKGRGQKITFTQMAGLYNEPHMGDQLFEDSDDYEELILNSYELEVDFLRHGVRYTERAEEFMGLRGELMSGIPDELGKWLGRQKTEKLFMMFLHKGSAENHVFAGNAPNADAITQSDILSWDPIVATRTQLERLSGKPAKVGKDQAGNTISRYVTVATTEALFSLETDDEFKQLGRDADTRGGSNIMFAGGFHDVRGQIIRKYNPIDHDGQGVIGSPLNPKSKLGRATTDGFLTVTGGTAGYVYGGGNATAAAKTNKGYYKYFPSYAYQFLANETLAVADSLYGDNDFYIAVVNPPNAATDPGKVGFYLVGTATGRASRNDGSKLSVKSRLASGAAAADAADITSVTTLGNIVWDASKHTNNHPANADVFLVNKNGVYLGHTLMLGQGAARRGYGKYRNDRSEDSHEGGFVREVYVTSVFGQEPRRDASGRRPGYMILTHAIQPAGTPYAGV